VRVTEEKFKGWEMEPLLEGNGMIEKARLGRTKKVVGIFSSGPMEGKIPCKELREESTSS
jgi:hypothetical protein